MAITDSETGQVIPITRLVRTAEDLDKVEFGNYDRIVVAVGDSEDSVAGDGVAQALFLGNVMGYQISDRNSKGVKTLGVGPRPYVDVRRAEISIQPQYEPQAPRRTCERAVTRKPMSIEQMAEFCAAMPPGVGEEEFLAELDNLGDTLGDVA